MKDEAWVRNPIDRFVLAKLEAKGLTPAPEADRRTLARRLSLDLTGLPPDPGRGRGVRRGHLAGRLREAGRPPARLAPLGRASGPLLARRGPVRRHPRHPLRQLSARCGRIADWVIEAFNRNQPFDQFTIEQLAGDLLPDRTLDQQIASGFNRCNITTNEGGAIAEEYLVLYTRDRTETASQVWLGMTAGCAVCHDHKFDPLTQKRVLRALGVLQQHDPGGDGRQHQGHAADHLRPRRPGPPPLGRPWAPSWPTPGRGSRPASRSPGPSSTSGSPRRLPNPSRR